MNTGKLLLMLIPLTLTVIAVVLGFKSYSIALRSQIRLKYCGYYHSDREEKILQEYKRKMTFVVGLFTTAVLILGVLAYLLVIVVRNNIPLT